MTNPPTESHLCKIKKAYQDKLKFKEDDVALLDCYVATFVAAVHPKLVDPVWMHFIGPPSCGKTEITRPLIGYQFCQFLSTVTENAFSSGANDEEGNDPSLLPKLDGKLVVFKDLTNMLSSDIRLVEKVYGDLRDIYDRYHSKASGMTGVREYSVSFGIVAAVTDMIDKFSESHRQLGERFLSVRMNRIPLSFAERIDFNKHIYTTMKDKDVWQKQLMVTIQMLVERIRQGIVKNPYVPDVPPDILENVVGIADLLSLMRTSALDGTAVSPELGSRVTQQLLNLGLAHAIADQRKELNQDDLALIKRVALDTLPTVRRRMMHWMTSRGEHRLGMSQRQLVGLCRTTKTAVNSVLVQYLHSNLLEVVPSDSGSHGDESVVLYRLTSEGYETINRNGFFKGDHLPKKRPLSQRITQVTVHDIK